MNSFNKESRSSIKYSCITFLLIVFVLSPDFCKAQDMILLTNGDELPGKVEKISNNEVTLDISKIKKSTVDKEIIHVRDIYMIKYKDRGNVYFLSDGRRNTGENQQLAKDADVIYLLSGMEIPAWNTKMEYGVVKYDNDKNKKKSKERIVNLNQIFMIKYADGSREVINDLSALRKEEYKKKAAAAKNKQSQKSDSDEPKYKVVFHTVKAGETLKTIATIYAVTPAQIREWNELNSSITEATKLKAGTQLMIQQLIK